MQFITDFADQAVILPFVFTIAFGLAAGGWARGALAWTLTCCVTLGAVGFAKLWIFVFGAPASIPDLLSPSGHTASAPLVYGGIAILLLGRRLGALAPAIFAGLIGYSRLALGEHTLPDVIVGGAIGLIGAIILAFAAGRRPDDLRRVVPVGLGAAVLFGFHGLRIPAEPWLHLLADLLARR